MKTRNFFKGFLFFLFIFSTLLLGFSLGRIEGKRQAMFTPPDYIEQGLLADTTVDFSLFWESWRRVAENFSDKEKLEPQKMIHGAIAGMIESLDDPYTVFFTPKQTESFNEELSGEYEGVGMVVGIKDGKLIVISPLKETPAFFAGLKAGDQIVKINSTSTANMTVEQAVVFIKGKKGTYVNVTVERKGWEETKEFRLMRDKIKIPTLEWEILQNDIAIIRVYQFNQILSQEFSKAVTQILKSQAKYIILDLRDNPGGYLDVAQNIGGWFLEKGKTIVIQVSAIEQENKTYESSGPASLAKFKTIVLINQGSASAAEILAGALRDQKQVLLIGEKSFGKGSVQQQISLKDGSSLKITVSKWLTPSGHSIDQQGLTPDIEVALEEEEKEEQENGIYQGIILDQQVKKAIEILKNSN